MASSPPPSPQATGGAGTIFEYRLAAIALGALLRGASIPGLVAPVEEVGLQQRIAGHDLDDVVARGRVANVEQTVEYQVKRTLAAIASDDDFVAVVGQCLSSIESHADDVQARRHRLGIAAGGRQGQLRDLRELTELARAHSTPSSMSLTLTSSRQGVRDRYDHLSRAIKIRLEAAGRPAETQGLQEWTWRVAAALYVWHVDAEDGGRDVIDAVNQLRDVVPTGSPASAEALFAHLTALAQAWGPRAGLVDGSMLRAELERRGVELSVAPAQRADFKKLVEASDRALRGISTVLGGSLTLPRAELVSETVEALAGQGAALLRGPAGVGKSALAALAMHQLREDGAVLVVVSLAGRTGQRLADLESELKVDLRSALRGAPTSIERVFLVDGAEEALTDQAQLLVSLLQVIPTDSEESPPFRVLLTARDEAADAVAEHAEGALGRALTQVSVSELTDAQVDQVLSGFPRLRTLARDTRPRRLLRRPYLVELLLRATANSALPKNLVGEEDVVDLVMDRLVRRAEGALPGRGAAEARHDVVAAMAEAFIANRVPASLPGHDSEARAGLTSDGVLQRVRDSYRFAHDVLADYAVVDHLLGHDAESMIERSVTPRRLLRAGRVWMQSLIARALEGTPHDVVEAWATAKTVASKMSVLDGPRWADLPYEALLNVGRAQGVLAVLEDTLFAADGAELIELIDVARRSATSRDASLKDSSGAALDVLTCAPLIRFLAEVASQLKPPASLSATGIVHAAATSLAARGAAAETELLGAELMPDALVTWAIDSTGVIEVTLAGLALLASVLTQGAEEYLLERARARHWSLDAIVEDPTVVRALVRSRADLMLRLAGLYYIDQELVLGGESSGDGPQTESTKDSSALGIDDDPILDFEQGVRSHSVTARGFSSEIVGFAHPSFGPFLELLTSSPVHGLRLVGAVVDVATEARIALEESWERSSIVIELRLPGWPEPREYAGTPDVWMWYRRNGTGPYPAMSALLALREWAGASVRSGRPVRDVAEDVLQCGHSLGLVAIAYSILVEHMEQVVNDLDAFLELPAVWDLETPRVLHETIGFAHPLADAPWLLWQPTQVAMLLALNSDSKGRERLRGVGKRLRQRHERSGGRIEDLVDDGGGVDAELGARALLGRRRETELNFDRYLMKKTESGTEITIAYPQEVVSGLLNQGGRVATLRLEHTGLATRAVKMRDGERGGGDPVAVWTRLQELSAELKSKDALTAEEDVDAAAAAAAAILVGARIGQSVDDLVLADGAHLLVDVALAPGEPSPDRDVRDMAWSLGADRSAAVGLSILALDSELCGRCGVDSATTRAGIIALAGSPFAEVRTRLASGLGPAWDMPCLDDPFAHEVALAALRELVATVGLGEWDGTRLPNVRLPQPLESALNPSRLVLSLRSAADALPGLIRASQITCEHGQAAHALLEALVDYDLGAWPNIIARHNWHMGDWRNELDALTAERALKGDPGQLRRYLEAFAGVGEELRGVLRALPEIATGEERVGRLLDVWAEIHDALLLGNRRIGEMGGKNPRYADLHDLDALLLPIPPDGVSWPAERTRQLLSRWHAAFIGAPHVTDQLIRFLVRFGWLISPEGTGLVLDVMGEDVRAVARESSLVFSWLRAVLVENTTVAGDRLAEVRTILDKLARRGEEPALALQRELEA